MAVTDIDFICRNVILGHPSTVIDYEWCFDFPIPVSYLVYRILHYYIYGKGSRAVLEKYQLFSMIETASIQDSPFHKCIMNELRSRGFAAASPGPCKKI